LQSQIAELTKVVRGVQSGADKQIGQVRSDVKRILELKEQGLSESQIHRELWIDQQMSGQSAPAPQPSNGNGQPAGAGFDAEPLIATLKFEPNDPALAALRIKYAGNPQGLATAAADLRLSQLNSPKPTPGTSIPPSNGNALQGSMTPQEMEAKSARLLRLYDNYTANKPEIETLEKELKAAWSK
jgi:hypothetical protein